MKKVMTLIAGVALLTMTGLITACNSSTLQTIFSGGTIANAFTSVIGLDKVTARGLVGTWNYNGPGIAFTSKDLLSKAGGEVAATKIEKEVEPYYNKVGLTAQNTYAIFDADKNYCICLDGHKFTGKYTFDEENAKITLKTMLIDINCYAKREYGGIDLLFESKVLLTVLRTITSFSSDETTRKFSDLSKNYDGIRIGFDMKKQ